MENIGRRVAEERIRLGLSQAALAERAGVSLKYLQRVEGGRENLTVASLVRFANLLQTAPVDLFKTARLRNAGPGRPAGTSARNARPKRPKTK
jgi:transcriptional regulator with XRE-family HTH domain